MRKFVLLLVVVLMCGLSGCASLDSFKNDAGILEECAINPEPGCAKERPC